MYKKIDKFRLNYTDTSYVVFRIVVGLLFAFHGAQKLFGLFTDRGAQPLFSLMGLAGVIEFFGGIMIAIGLFTSITAIISSVEMVFAFFMSHFTLANPIPILNRGELTLLYFAAFLYIAFHGSGRFAVDRVLRKK
jgi:putative oxidoreductase